MIVSVFRRNQSNLALVFIVLLGFFLRLYLAKPTLSYGHDADVASWIVKDIVVNKHLRLIGQLTSNPGIFIGPLFYYLLVPFYLLVGMDPIGALGVGALIGFLGITSFYLVFSKLYGTKTGLISAALYLVSYLAIFNDREIVPTMTVLLWSVWYFYGLMGLLKGKKESYLILGFLSSLIWHINLALALLLPLIPLSYIFSGKKLQLRSLVMGLGLLMLTSLPLMLFEFRHNFPQSRALLEYFLTSETKDIYVGSEKLARIIYLVSKNSARFLWGPTPVNFYWAPILLSVASFYLLLKKVLSKKIFLIISIWQLLYIAFFATSKIPVSEYYLYGMVLVWFLTLILFVTYLFEAGRGRKTLGLSILGIYALVNIYWFFKNIHAYQQIGYSQKMSLVNFIAEDSRQHNYPCIAVSYLTAPGYELGYRYLFWLEKMHVNQPRSGSPVYTIVFPHGKAERLDKTFGALGLVLPDYSRYNDEEVGKSCSGTNSNLADPMPSYTD